MDGPIAVAWVQPPVDSLGIWEAVLQRLHEFVLSSQGHVANDPQTGDVLHLAQPRGLAGQLVDDRVGGLQPRRRLKAEVIAKNPLHFAHGRVVFRPQVLQPDEVLLGHRVAAAKAAAELVDLRVGE